MRKKQTYSRFIQNVLTWNDLSKGRMIKFLHHCVEHDITTFDNSDFRGTNYAGKVFGVALSESGLSRDEIQLISKFGLPETDGDKLIETVDNILLNLETDYLDLLLLDYPHFTKDIKHSVERLFAQGKILEVGGLNLEESQMKDFGITLGVNQVPSPFTSPNALAQIPSVVKASEEIIHFVWCNPQSNISKSEIKIFRDLSSQYHVSENQLYLMWILEHPAHLHPVICTSEKEGITEAVSSKEKKLDPVDWQKINLILF